MKKFILPLFSAFMLLSVPVLLYAQDEPGGSLDALVSLSALLTYLFTIASSAILGAVKGFLEKIDMQLSDWIKPFQPIAVGILGILLPLLCKALGIEVFPADVLAAAPLGTVIAVTLRELLERLQRPKPPKPV